MTAWKQLRDLYIREVALYLSVMAALFGSFFVYVLVDQGVNYAFSIENLSWFAHLALVCVGMAAGMALLSSLFKT